MSKIREFIQAHYKFINISLLVFAIVLQSHYKFSIPLLATDSMWQYMSARAFWEGHGISIISPDVHDLSAKVYTTQVHWAPGVPVVISPLLYITGYNIIISEWILTTLCIAILFITWFYILRMLKPYVDDLLLPAIMLFWAFANTPIRISGMSDILSLSSISVSVYFLLKLFLTPDIRMRKEIFYIVLASIAAFLSCFSRYAYYGVTFSVPLLIFTYGLLGNRKYLKYSILSAIIITVLVIPEYRFMVSPQKQVADHDIMESIDNVHRRSVAASVRWELLQYLDQIFTNGFFPEGIVGKLLGSDGMHEPAAMSGIVFLAILSAFIGILLIIGLFKLLAGVGRTNNSLTERQGTLFRWLFHPVIAFLTISIVIIAANTGLIAYLELRYRGSYEVPYFGYLNNGRYFVITYFLIQTIAFIILFSKDLVAGKSYKKLLFITLLTSFTFNVAHWGYIKMKFSLYDYEYNLGFMKIPQGAPADYFLLQRAVADNGLPVVFVGNNTDAPEVLNPKYKNKFMHVFAAIAGASMSNFQKILDSGLKTSKPVEVWIPISTREPENVLVDFCLRNNAVKKMTLERAGYDIMSITIQPNL